MTDEDGPIVCCFATKITSGAHNMIETMKLNNWKFNIMAQGEKWAGWTMRMKAYADHARNQLNPNTVIVFADCYDVLTLKGPQGFLEKFHAFNADIVVGADSICSPWNCTPTETYWKNLQTLPQDATYRYANGGFVVGKAFALVAMYDWAIANNQKDDQKAICAYMNAIPSANIKLDSDKILVFNDSTDILRRKPTYIFRENRLHIVSNDREITPFFVHFPGFLVFPTVAFFIKEPRRTSLRNYYTVGQHLLGPRFTEIGQVDGRAHTGRIVMFWFLLTVILVLLLILIVSHLVRSAKRKP